MQLFSHFSEMKKLQSKMNWGHFPDFKGAQCKNASFKIFLVVMYEDEVWEGSANRFFFCVTTTEILKDTFLRHVPNFIFSTPMTRARNYKRNVLVQGTSSPKIYLSERLRACPDLVATDQLSWGQVPLNLLVLHHFYLSRTSGQSGFSNPGAP